MFEHYITELIYFAEQGGGIIWILLVVCLLLWTLIFERIWFIKITSQRKKQRLVRQWQNRMDRSSWLAHKIREGLISQVKMDLFAVLPLIKTLIAICPLLGLLGTVTGMVAVFDVIAVVGTSDAQAMANGVYRATIPTMAGLVVAISGMYFSSQLNSWADRQAGELGDQLTVSVGGSHGC